ncbi:hypothetical protein CALCODRAFT_481714 [Calocera cornea HHB12733]|uniref:Uncharacterized protein n=1 Tax=Calocera cornea HHB12733 TaxID=1353952 RepID=A0A165HCH9_9BASI|nr:hypothetical protein CALCODRAFT_481714 [Calocera cornea HHB12733]
MEAPWLDPGLSPSPPPIDPGLLLTMNLVEEIRDLMAVYDVESKEVDQLARGRRIKFLTHELSARPALHMPPPLAPAPQADTFLGSPPSSLPSSVPETQLPVPQTQPSCDTQSASLAFQAPLAPPDDRIDDSSSSQNEIGLTPLSKPRKKRPALKADLDDGAHPPKRVAGALTRLEKQGFDETDIRMKKTLQASREMLRTMQRLIGYAAGRTMPNSGGPPPDEEAGVGPFLIPNFHAKLTDIENLRIQQRAADAVLRTQMSEEGVVPPAYRPRWLDENVLIDLAQKSWPGMKAVWQTQVHDAKDNGAASALRRRQGKRRERRNIAADQIRKGIKEFCEDNQLNHALVELELVNEEWMGEEWSGDEEGIQTPAWRQSLFEKGSISAHMRDSPGRVEALELRRPVWMHPNLWEWFKAQRAGRPRTQKKPEKPRADLGNVSHRMPEVIPFDFMLNPQWAATQLPKWDESYWKRRTGWPTSLGTRAQHITASMLTAPTSGRS